MKKNSLAGVIVGLILVGLLIISAIFASVLTGYDPVSSNIQARFSPPSLQHPFGADSLGRDMFSRVFYGLRTSLGISFLASIIALIVGGALGLAAAFAGGFVDKVVTSLMRFLGAGPGILLAIVIATKSPGAMNLALCAAILLLPGFARNLRGVVLYLINCNKKEKGYVWNAIGTILARVSLSITLSVMVVSALGFIGFGVQPPTPEFGALISTGREYLRMASFLITFPGLFLTFTVASFGILGGSLSTFLNRRSENSSRDTSKVS